MGHSFGTIVVSGMLGGPDAAGQLPRPVDSVALGAGRRILVVLFGAISRLTMQVPVISAASWPMARCAGPIVTTQSKHDNAVGFLYPLASRIKGSANFAGTFPKFGAIGAFGLQGVPDGSRSELTMLGASAAYQFASGKVYNVDGSQFIAHMDGVSGAHSDIAGPEVAHLIWAAALASAAG